MCEDFDPPDRPAAAPAPAPEAPAEWWGLCRDGRWLMTGAWMRTGMNWDQVDPRAFASREAAEAVARDYEEYGTGKGVPWTPALIGVSPVRLARAEAEVARLLVRLSEADQDAGRWRGRAEGLEAEVARLRAERDQYRRITDGDPR